MKINIITWLDPNRFNDQENCVLHKFYTKKKTSSHTLTWEQTKYFLPKRKTSLTLSAKQLLFLITYPFIDYS